MCKNNTNLTASNIRYLVALNSLDNKDGIRCVDIAKELGLAKPSIHRMMKKFLTRNLIRQARYGMVYLTDEGREFAARYAGYYDTVSRFFLNLSLSPQNSENAAYALLAIISEESADDMCKNMFKIINDEKEMLTAN